MSQLEFDFQAHEDRDAPEECLISLCDLLRNVVSPAPIELCTAGEKGKPVFSLTTRPGVSRLIDGATADAFIGHLRDNLAALCVTPDKSRGMQEVRSGHFNGVFTIPRTRLDQFFCAFIIRSSWIFEEDAEVHVEVDVRFSQHGGTTILEKFTIAFYDGPYTRQLLR